MWVKGKGKVNMILGFRGWVADGNRERHIRSMDKRETDRYGAKMTMS